MATWAFLESKPMDKALEQEGLSCFCASAHQIWLKTASPVSVWRSLMPPKPRYWVAWSPLPGWRTGSSRMRAGRAEERPTYAGLRDVRWSWVDWAGRRVLTSLWRVSFVRSGWHSRQCSHDEFAGGLACVWGLLVAGRNIGSVCQSLVS